MMRLAGLALVAVLVAFPLAAWPAAPAVWLASITFVVGGAGIVLESASLVTIAAALALMAYTLALVVARPGADPVAAVVFGAVLVVLLVLAQFAGLVRGAALGPGVVAAQVRQWVSVVLLGVVAAGVLTLAAAALAPVLAGSTLPMVVAVAVLGAALTVAGVVALTTRDR